MPESDPRIGWKIVDARRNEVPLQNASTAEPATVFVITFAFSVVAQED